MSDFVPGGVANWHGDLWGTSPLRVIPHGRIVIDRARAEAALECGWRALPKSGECDDDFVWMERTADEREQYATRNP